MPVSVNGTASIATNGADFVELVSINIDERGVGLFPTYELADLPGDTPFLLQLTFGDLDGATPTPLDLNTTVAEFLALGAPLQPWPQISYLPLTIEVPLPTIAEIAVGTPELSTLVAAVTAASAAGNIDFLAAISDPDADLTVFAPTDDAFAALGDTLTAALADPGGLLTDVLAYHVLGTSEAAADLIAAGTATTLLGSDVTITVDDNGNVFINNSQVIIADVQAANGIVHVIDAVLLPPSDDTPIFDCAKITLKNKAFGGFLSPNRRGNVVIEHRATNDSVWKLEDTGMGSFYLRNVHYGYYLDADSSSRRYNVDLGNRDNHGTKWNIMQRDNGTYVLQNVDYHRYLDGDVSNVDTSSSVRADDEWVIELTH